MKQPLDGLTARALMQFLLDTDAADEKRHGRAANAASPSLRDMEKKAVKIYCRRELEIDSSKVRVQKHRFSSIRLDTGARLYDVVSVWEGKPLYLIKVSVSPALSVTVLVDRRMKIAERIGGQPWAWGADKSFPKAERVQA